MELILWRHAEAVDGTPDLQRSLSLKGLKQAHQMARWLKSRLPKTTRILVSPALRTRQTAAALTEEFDVIENIGPGASPSDILSAAGWPGQKGAVLVVGHQPTLGMVAAMLIAGKPMPWSVRKGAVWWLSNRVREEHAQIVLRACLSPDML